MGNALGRDDICSATMSSVGRSFGFSLLGAIVGAATGAGLGLLGGLGYTELASVSGFEGESGFVVGYWMLGGLLVGLCVGVYSGLRLARRPR
jgi:hypothetical protein